MKRFKEERGAVAVLAALTIVILFAAVAFVIDISRLYHERQVLQNAVDFGSLAGAQDLPVQGAPQAAIASADALKVATANAPQVTAATSRSSTSASSGTGTTTVSPIPKTSRSCAARLGTWSSGWIKKGATRMVHDCLPFSGDRCNTIRLATSNTIPYYFAPVIGINNGRPVR